MSPTQKKTLSSGSSGFLLLVVFVGDFCVYRDDSLTS